MEVLNGIIKVEASIEKFVKTSMTQERKDRTLMLLINYCFDEYLQTSHLRSDPLLFYLLYLLHLYFHPTSPLPLSHFASSLSTLSLHPIASPDSDLATTLTLNCLYLLSHPSLNPPLHPTEL